MRSSFLIGAATMIATLASLAASLSSGSLAYAQASHAAPAGVISGIFGR